ncbi:MAG: hypothetical protein GTN76_01365 [Candidatus Aenigmarchaeota archaeon]|nr:hypothetical protein [Candidatus Aenigmarchaeota archaeon]
MRAQTGIEFMVLFGIFLVAIMILVFVVWDYVLDINVSTIDLQANGVLDKISGKLETVFLEGHGFSANLTLPEEISGMNYSVDIGNGFVFLNMSSRIYTKRLITRNVTGVIKKGENIIENLDGIVVIS